MLISKLIAVGIMLPMISAAALVMPGTELVPAASDSSYGQSFRNLKHKTGQAVRKLLRLEPREELIYYGDYQAYGNYGNYGIYGGGGGGSGSSSTTKSTSQASAPSPQTPTLSPPPSTTTTTSIEYTTTTSMAYSTTPSAAASIISMSTSTSTSTVTSYSTTVTSTLSVPTIISQSSENPGPVGNIWIPLVIGFVQGAPVIFV